MKRTTQIEMNNEAQNEARKKALELESLVWNDNLSDKVCFINNGLEIIVTF